ncbi:MAG TPA: cupredoxin domain-containing protein [Chloroflexia bacterium]|nr:cupredoxin domain-containing protein [Chloroflexia bacterium]
MYRLYALLGIALMALTAYLTVPQPATPSGVTQVTMNAADVRLTPATLTVPAGKSVSFTFSNTGHESHNMQMLLSGEPQGPPLFETNLRPGETTTVNYVFDKPGLWSMACPMPGHAEAGIAGTIRVVRPAADGIPAEAAVAAGLLGVCLLASGGLTWMRRSRPAA